MWNSHQTTFDSMVLLLEYRDIENDTCDVCEHFERCYLFQNVFEHSPETHANCVIGIDMHDVRVKPNPQKIFDSLLFLCSVACDHDRLDMSRGS